MTEVKVEVFEQTPSFIHARYTYPNGFIVETKQSSENIDVKTNWDLVKEADGSYTPVKPSN